MAAKTQVIAYVVPFPQILQLPATLTVFVGVGKLYLIHSRVAEENLQEQIAEAEQYFIKVLGSEYQAKYLKFVALPYKPEELPLIEVPVPDRIDTEHSDALGLEDMTAQQANARYSSEQFQYLKDRLDEELNDISLACSFNLAKVPNATIQEVMDHPLFDVHRESQKIKEFITTGMRFLGFHH
jgi:hypothetical protein